MLSDEQLMVRFQDGAREAFEELFDRYRRPIYGFFRRRLNDIGRAEDLTQEKDLNNKVQFATIQLEIAEEYRAELEPPAPGTGTQLRNALVDGIRSGAENVLGIVLFLLRYGPVLLLWLLLIGPLAVLLWRKIAAMQIAPIRDNSK